MKSIGIDIETFSSVDLAKSGVYRYVQSPDFTVLLLAYTFDGATYNIVDFASGDTLPYEVLIALRDPYTTKTAHNANFERTCLAKFLGFAMPPQQWSCTMAKAAQVGLPLGLDAVASVLKLTDQKDKEGKALIRYFCVPCKPTKTNGGRTRNLPQHDPEKWQKFKEYCIQDVRVEQAVRSKIDWFEVPKMEVDLWNLDQKINDRGVLVDPVFIRQAIGIDQTYREQMISEAVQITGLDNPNSVSQLKTWLETETDTEILSLNKEKTTELLESVPEGPAKKVLEIRQKISKTSVKKYASMINCLGDDHRVRGLLQYYGANRTGRWAGRLIQVQNLPQNKISDLELARTVAREGDGDLLSLLYDNTSDILSQLIRTAFVSPEGYSLLPTDFSAIEARVLAWLAGETWRLDVFKTHGKIYEASASQMFKVPLDSIGKGSPLRQKGKVAELALGYQGGPGALVAMGALKMGIPEEELPVLVNAWRKANPKIVRYWYTVQDACKEAIGTGEPQSLPHGIKVFMKKGAMLITLPSGRQLSYLRAKLKPGKFGDAIIYEGMDQTTKQWKQIDTYGGKLVENVTQSVARDCLADAMLRLDAAGFKIVMHVHDEAVLEEPDLDIRLDLVNEIMGTPIPWAKGLPLKAESYVTKFYKKD